MQQPTQAVYRGFTLIELLLVMVIIAILAGLVLPALAAAKRKSVGTACASQTRQLGLAFTLYCDDNADRVPPNRDGKSLPIGETWIEGWLGLPGPDCTNVTFLERSLLGRYVPAVTIWRCPAAKPVRLGGVSQLRVRTFSINGFVGSPVVSPVATTYRKQSDFVRPGPAQQLTIVEERAETINDGAFSLQWEFNEAEPARWLLRDQPATLHGRSGNCAFADGHGESPKWVDFLLSNPNRNDQPAPGNRDLLWLQRHATWRATNRDAP